MEENKLCQCCGKNHAARCYEEKKSSERKFYCLDCYSRLFLDGGNGDSLTTCPYCGTTFAEVKASKLVGCAHCYQSMWEGIFPLVEKMQGREAHNGKLPPVDGVYGGFDGEDYTPEYRAEAMKQARFQRQCRELEIIIEKLKAEEAYEEAKGYADKLSAMKNNAAIEEDFVWRTRRQ